MVKKIGFVVLVIAAALFWWRVALWVLSARDIPPPVVTDLMPDRPEVAAEDNAYGCFLKAEELLDFTEKESEVIKGFLNGNTNCIDFLRKTLANKEPALAMIEKGLKRDYCQRPVPTDFGLMFPNFSKRYKLGHVLECKARLYKQAGLLDEAVNSCVALIRYSSLLMKSSDSIRLYSASDRILKNGCALVRMLAFDNNIKERDLKLVLDTLKTLDSRNEMFEIAVKNEFYTMDKLFSNYHAGSMDMLERQFNIKIPLSRKKQDPGYVLKVNKTKQMFAEYYRCILQNSSRTYEEIDFQQLEEFDSGDLDLLKLALKPNMIGIIMFDAMKISASDKLTDKFVSQSEHSATLLILALNLYKREIGDFPERLEELVPKYIDAIPCDPCDGKPFRYNKAKDIVYSVGVNLADDGGSSEWIEGDAPSCDCRHFERKKDITFSISGNVKY